MIECLMVPGVIRHAGKISTFRVQTKNDSDMNITAEMKDDVLEVLSRTDKVGQIDEMDIEDFTIYADIDRNSLSAILEHFKSLGFISNLNERRRVVFFCLTLKGYEFFKSGGFSS